VTLGARLPYRQAAAVLREFLPQSHGFNHVTTRNRTLAVGRAIDEELCREIAQNAAPPTPADQLRLGIDGAFVKAKRTTGRTHFEVLTGRIESAGQRNGKAFAVVRDLDALAKPRGRALLRRHGHGPETALTVLSDGEEGMRTIVGTWFGKRSVPGFTSRDGSTASRTPFSICLTSSTSRIGCSVIMSSSATSGGGCGMAIWTAPTGRYCGSAPASMNICTWRSTWTSRVWRPETSITSSICAGC
jgi:hypothetical protein